MQPSAFNQKFKIDSYVTSSEPLRPLISETMNQKYCHNTLFAFDNASRQRPQKTINKNKLEI